MTSDAPSTMAIDAAGTSGRRPRPFKWVLLLCLAFAPPLFYWRCVCCYGIVERLPERVSDVPGYGEDLRRQKLNPPEPAQPPPKYSGPGKYLRWSPDGTWVATTTGAAGFYRTVNVWNERERRLTPLISIEDSDPG